MVTGNSGGLLEFHGTQNNNVAAMNLNMDNYSNL